MKVRKGTSASVVLLAIVAIVGLSGTAYFLGQGSTAPSEEVEYDGQFNQLQDVQELTGYNDLSVSTINLNDTSTAATFTTKNNVNDTNGETSRFVYGIDVDGAINDVDVESSLPSARTGDEFVVQEVKLVRDDDDDVSISEARAIETFSPDSNGEFDTNIGAVEDGEYAFVFEVKGSNADSLSGGEDLYTIEWDAGEAESDEDGSDEVQVTIQNAN